MCLPCCDFLYRTVTANLNTLKIKDLRDMEKTPSVWVCTRRVYLDAHDWRFP